MMSVPTTIARAPSLHEQDAAMSLCAMGSFEAANVQHRVPPSPSPSNTNTTDNTQDMLNIVDDDQSRISDTSNISVITPPRTKGKIPPKKRVIKRGDSESSSKRDPRVSFEEMKRLMRVYGPTKCLRNRTPKESGKCTKILSVKRKFYRWFPDFHQRFDLQPGNWYKPKIGHEMEMKYREELRTKDQAVLAAKRIAKKNSTQRELCNAAQMLRDWS